MTDFTTALRLVLAHEGGYSDHPRDPGGATMRGVTQRVYDAWRRRAGRPVRPVRQIEDAELQAIYRLQYWDVVRGDDLPAGLAYAVFDYAVNSGPAQAVRDLQRALGVAADGAMGNVTLAAADDCDSRAVVRDLCARRLAMLRGLRTWGTFGRGWAARVDGVERDALAMIAGDTPALPRATPDAVRAPAHKADPADKGAGAVAAEFTAKEVLGAAGGVAGALGTLAAAPAGPIPWAVAAILVMVAAALIVIQVRKRVRS